MAQGTQSAAARCGQKFPDPNTSQYLLPFPAGRSYTMFQGNCPPDPRWGHNGWLAYDFDLAIGDSVLASREGLATYVEQRWPNSDRVCGHENSVWITHDDRTVMAYLHLTTNGARVRVGDRVSAGTLLGLSGDSGCSSGPHLHVGLFKDATNFDKESSRPLNFRNADGPLAANNALVQGARYAARTP
ncbi:MAG: M23 family metallopeptidase [Gemmatimonadales bacterium]|nr:M23 family metallopeptidase [Gemmatimonadales bacterium]